MAIQPSLSDLVANSEDRFSRDAAHIMSDGLKLQLSIWVDGNVHGLMLTNLFEDRLDSFSDGCRIEKCISWYNKNIT